MCIHVCEYFIYAISTWWFPGGWGLYVQSTTWSGHLEAGVLVQSSATWSGHLKAGVLVQSSATWSGWIFKGRNFSPGASCQWGLDI